MEKIQSVLAEKRTTFLLGAGASVPFFSSLGKIEEYLSNQKLDESGKSLVMVIFYYIAIKNNDLLIKHILEDKSELKDDKVLFQYSRFVYNVIEFLKLRNSRVSPRRTNIFTTNYDLFLEAGY